MPDFDQVLEESHAAVDAFVRGDSKPLEQLYSRRDDVTLGNPFGPFVRGFEEVARTMERAASYYREGRATGFDLVAKVVTPELAFTVEVERVSSKIGGSDEESPVSLRVTSIFRSEDDGWKLLHRHADPITAPRAPDSVIQS
ncbi:MAG TPA: nuclear transport factor 2 family protein [Actinomycetota bacterium]